MKVGKNRLRAAALAALTSTFVFSTGAVAPVPAANAATAPTRASSVIALAKAQLGDPWVHYAVGPRAFDCSGLVYYVFRKTGNLTRIGGRRSAYGYLAYFRHRGLASRSGGQPGDLVVWGGGSHVGIYLGHGKAISTLTNGVRIHGIYAVRARFTAFLHTRLSGTTVSPAVVTAPAAPVLAPAAPVLAPEAPVVAPEAPVLAPEASAVAPETLPATTSTPVTETTAAPSTAALPKTATTRRTTVSLNLRTGPGTHKHRIRVLRAGTLLTILGSRRDSLHRLWYHVRLRSGATGWVAGWYTRA